MIVCLRIEQKIRSGLHRTMKKGKMETKGEAPALFKKKEIEIN